MEYILGLNMVSTAEATILMVATYIATQITKKTTKVNNNYMPAFSVVYGMIISLLIGMFVFHDANIYQTVLVGFLIGGATSGVFTGVKGIVGGYNIPTAQTTSTDENKGTETSEWKPTKEQQNTTGKEEK